ncbi:MAG: hypothetical protein AB8B48_00920 [Pseudomonadales bacterium]
MAPIAILTVAVAEDSAATGFEDCLTEQEHAEVVRRHTELGALETEMGCKELVKFSRQIHLEKRALHRQTIEAGLSADEYALQLNLLERRESAYRDETVELRERCMVPVQEMLALKRKMVTVRLCSLVPLGSPSNTTN